MNQVEFTNQLPNDEVDKGDVCTIELAKIEDDCLPEVELKVVKTVRRFVEAFFSKMRDSLPWDMLAALSKVNPSNLAHLEVRDCK